MDRSQGHRFDPAGSDPAAAARSARLVERIRTRIAASGGWIPFSEFMAAALYDPDAGYYSAGDRQFGPMPSDGSDFVTAPELGRWFAAGLARGIAPVLRDGVAHVVEFGAGTGALAADLLIELDALGCPVARYEIVDVSPALRARQRATIEARAPQHAHRVAWLAAPPRSIPGVAIGNEVLDAMPVRLVARVAGRWLERGVVASGERALAFEDRPGDESLLAAVAVAVPDADLPDGYVTERHEAADAFVTGLAESLEGDAVALLIDYGFPASEYFHSQRSAGTLMTHERHRSGFDVLDGVGLRDISTHVDFTSVARAARAGGAAVLGFSSQAAWLLDTGLLDVVAARGDDTTAAERTALRLLLSEAEMGELVKVIALGRRIRPLPGFRRDRSMSL